MAKVGRKQFGSTADEQAIVSRVRLMARKRKGGKRPSLASIARTLNAEGIRTKMGRLWRAQTVKGVLAGSNDTANSSAVKKIKKTGLGTGDYLTREQLRRLFKVACAGSSDNQMIIAVLVGSGLRASEIVALQVRDLGIWGGKSQIDVRRGKGAKQRCVFISQELSATLREYLAARYRLPRKSMVFDLTYDALYKRVKKLGVMAGLPGLHPHTLRHTFGTFLYSYRKDLFFVMEQLGHSKVDTTQIYAKTMTDSKLEQMNALGNDLAGVLKVKMVPENTSKPESSM